MWKTVVDLLRHLPTSHPITPQAWREGAADQKARIAKLLAAAQRWHQPLLAEAFAEWREWVHSRQLLAVQLRTAVAHWMNASVATAFNTWRYQVGGSWGGVEVCLSSAMQCNACSIISTSPSRHTCWLPTCA